MHQLSHLTLNLKIRMQWMLTFCLPLIICYCCYFWLVYHLFTICLDFPLFMNLYLIYYSYINYMFFNQSAATLSMTTWSEGILRSTQVWLLRMLWFLRLNEVTSDHDIPFTSNNIVLLLFWVWLVSSGLWYIWSISMALSFALLLFSLRQYALSMQGWGGIHFTSDIFFYRQTKYSIGYTRCNMII